MTINPFDDGFTLVSAERTDKGTSLMLRTAFALGVLALTFTAVAIAKDKQAPVLTLAEVKKRVPNPPTGRLVASKDVDPKAKRKVVIITYCIDGGTLADAKQGVLKYLHDKKWQRISADSNRPIVVAQRDDYSLLVVARSGILPGKCLGSLGQIQVDWIFFVRES